MSSFKKWLELQEISLGSDGMRDNSPTQTANASQKVANQWMGSPQNSKVQGDLIGRASQTPSALPKQLMNAAATAVKTAPPNIAAQTNAAQVGKVLQNNLGLPSVIKTPKFNPVKMMRTQ